MDSLGNIKCHVKSCRGLSAINVICGCCGRQFNTWRQICGHVNQGGFHRRESSLTGYDGTTASILAHYPAAASWTAPIDIPDNISDMLDTPPLLDTPTPVDTPTLTPPLHDIFLDPPSSPDTYFSPQDNGPTPSVNFCQAQNEPAPDNSIDLGMSLAELAGLLRQHPSAMDHPTPTTLLSPQLPIPDFPDLLLEEPLPAGNVPPLSSPPAPPPPPASANPDQPPTAFHPCCRPACNSLLAESCYYKDLAQQFAIMLGQAHNKLQDLSPMLFPPESPQDSPHQKLLREGPWTYQVAQIGDLPFPQNLDLLVNALPTILYIPPME